MLRILNQAGFVNIKWTAAQLWPGVIEFCTVWYWAGFHILLCTLGGPVSVHSWITHGLHAVPFTSHSESCSELDVPSAAPPHPPTPDPDPGSTESRMTD